MRRGLAGYGCRFRQPLRKLDEVPGTRDASVAGPRADRWPPVAQRVEEPLAITPREALKLIEPAAVRDPTLIAGQTLGDNPAGRKRNRAGGPGRPGAAPSAGFAGHLPPGGFAPPPRRPFAARSRAAATQEVEP